MIFFRSDEHKTRFLESLAQIDKIYNGTLDTEYATALYILTSHLSTWNKVQSYVSCEGIDIEEMLEEVDLTGGESVLIKLAGNLFNSQTHIDPIELLRLDEANFHIALISLKLRRTRSHVDDFKD